MAYLNKELSNEEMLQVDRWLIQSSDNMDLLNDVRSAWKMTGTLEPNPVQVDTNQAWNKVLGQINTSGQKVIPIQSAQPKRRMLFAVAAAVIALVGVSTVFLFQDGGNSGKLELTAQNEVINERLSDGTDVTLNANSVLAYPPEFDENERRVELKGEAFFDVERNEEKPFVIDLPNEFYVKVLGTSFNIKAIDGSESTEVFVNSGKVEFGSESDKIILTAGEKGIMDNATGKVEKISNEVEAMKEMFWMDQYMEFRGKSVSQIVETLNELYTDKVVLNCIEQSEKILNTTLRQESLEEFLENLASTANLKVNKETSESGTIFYLDCHD